MEKKDTNIHSEYKASSKDEFLRYLKQQDISVPARTEGRTSQDCERWAVFRLLATWATGDYFSYPLRLVHEDKPDFRVYYSERELGIEFSEATSQEMAETAALAAREGKDSLLFMDQFKRGTKKRTASERRKIIQDKKFGAGWADDEPEREWKLCMMDRVLAKTEDFNKPDFEKFDKNWLLIYDNLPLPHIKIDVAMRYLMKHLNRYWLKKNRYDGVLIETGNELVEIHPPKWNQKPIIDLWS